MSRTARASRPANTTRRRNRGLRVVGSAFAISALMLASVSCGTEDSGDTGKASSSANEPDDQISQTATDDSRHDDNDTAHRSHGSKNKRSEKPGKSDAEQEVDASTAKPHRPRGKTYLVTDVVDGDTVHLDKPGETSVRIIGIDTPETVDPSTPVECGGPAASAAAERMLAGQRVRLVYDPTQGRVDSYGRVLGYIDLPGGRDYGQHMVTRGLAAEYTYDTAYQRRPQYLAAQRRAQDANRGVWNRCGGVDTPLEQPEPDVAPETQAPPADSGANCAPGYDPCVPPSPPDLDCADVDGPIRITGDDPHGFDADGDGIGCDT